jgi:hypothetical protein
MSFHRPPSFLNVGEEGIGMGVFICQSIMDKRSAWHVNA